MFSFRYYLFIWNNLYYMRQSAQKQFMCHINVFKNESEEFKNETIEA